MTSSRRRPPAKRTDPKRPPTKPAAKPARPEPDGTVAGHVTGLRHEEPGAESPSEPTVTVDMASRARGVVIAEIPLDRTHAIRITDLTDESPAEPLLTEQAHNDLLATAGIRASDVEAAGRLRRNGCNRAAREMMLCSLRQQADRLGIPTELPL